MKKTILIFMFLGFLLAPSFVLADWSDPTCDPADQTPGAGPGVCNVETPLNTSSASQTKAGPLIIQGGDQQMLKVFSTAGNDGLIMAFANTGTTAQLQVRDLNDNPEFQLQYGSANDDHWSIYVSNGVSKDLRIWGPNGGADRLTIEASGNVGIGQTSPLAPLDIKSSSADSVRWTDNTGGMTVGKLDWVWQGDGTHYGQIKLYQLDSLKVQLAGKGDSYFNSGGNVGIGTTAPNRLLHVYKDSGDNAEIDIQSVAGADEHWAIYHDRTSEDLRFWNNGPTGEKNVLTLTDDGRAGIGVVTPGAALEVLGNIIASVPTASNHVATKGYVDAAVGGAGGVGIYLSDQDNDGDFYYILKNSTGLDVKNIKGYAHQFDCDDTHASITSAVDGMCDPDNDGLLSYAMYNDFVFDGDLIGWDLNPGGSDAAASQSGTIIYITIQSFQGNLGERIGADNLCAGNKPIDLNCSNIHSFISVDESDEIRDMPANYGYAQDKPVFWYHTSSKKLLLLDSSWADMLDNNISNNQQSGTGVENYVWTGSEPNGARQETDDTCYHWTISGSPKWGVVGNFGSVNYTWLKDGIVGCGNQRWLRCACTP